MTTISYFRKCIFSSGSGLSSNQLLLARCLRNQLLHVFAPRPRFVKKFQNYSQKYFKQFLTWKYKYSRFALNISITDFHTGFHFVPEISSNFNFQSFFRDNFRFSNPKPKPRLGRATAQLLNNFLCFDFDLSQWQIARSVTWPIQPAQFNDNLSYHSKVSADLNKSWEFQISLSEIS